MVQDSQNAVVTENDTDLKWTCVLNSRLKHLITEEHYNYLGEIYFDLPTDREF